MKKSDIISIIVFTLIYVFGTCHFILEYDFSSDFRNFMCTLHAFFFIFLLFALKKSIEEEHELEKERLEYKKELEKKFNI